MSALRGPDEAVMADALRELRDREERARRATGESREVADNWQHRSRGMHCSTCMFYVPKGHGPSPLGESGLFVARGRCRRHAPTMSGYPVVMPDDWCGDHKLA